MSLWFSADTQLPKVLEGSYFGEALRRQRGARGGSGRVGLGDFLGGPGLRSFFEAQTSGLTRGFSLGLQGAQQSIGHADVGGAPLRRCKELPEQKFFAEAWLMWKVAQVYLKLCDTMIL